MNRRELLAMVGAATVSCGDRRRPEPSPTTPQGPAPDRAPEPPDWEAPGTWDEAVFAWGLAAGDPTVGGALLWVRTTAASVTLVVMEAADGDWREVIRSTGLPVRDEIAVVDVGDLLPDTAYRFAFYGDADARTPVGRFRTAPDDGAHRRFVIGATSCLGHGDPAFTCLEAVPAAAVDVFLQLGDTVYADGATSLEDYRAYWREVASVPAYRDATASAAIVATWDDHEVENNWTLGEPSPTQTQIPQSQLTAGARAWREALPMRRGPGGSGNWRVSRFGVVDVFVLDCRGERAGDVLISEEQLAWFEREVVASTARFQLVMTSVHATDHAALLGPVEAQDRWQGYPAQRDRLVAAAEAARGALFVTGDMHYGAIQRVGAAGDPGDGLYEVAAGPAGSDVFGLGGIVALADEAAKAQYLDVIDGYNWARLVFDPGLGTVAIELWGPDGDVVVSRTVNVP